MMELLSAMGMEAVCDGNRAPDVHNPRGYWEDARTLRLAEESDWLWECGGRSIKILYRQLRDVPPELPARLVLMRRDPAEVAASQAAMLGESGLDRDWADLLARDSLRFESWLREQHQWPVHPVEHRRLLEQPEEVLASLLHFLGEHHDLEPLLARVRPELYRSRCP